MSADKKKPRRSILNRLQNLVVRERTSICIFLSIVLLFFNRSLITARIGMQGSAYLFSAFDLSFFFLLLFPLGVSETLFELVGWRRENAYFKSAARLFGNALIHLLIYLLLISFLWVILAPKISSVFMGHGSETIFYWMLPVFIIDSLTLLFRGYADGHYKSRPTAYAFLFRQGSLFLLLLLFAGSGNKTGQHIADLLRSRETAYIYNACSVVRLYLIASVLGLAVYIFLLLQQHGERMVRIQNDNDQRRESPIGTIYVQAIPVSLCTLCFCLPHFTALLITGLKTGGSDTILRSYRWGGYAGICLTLCLFPLALIFLIMRNDSGLIRRAIEEENTAELRLRFAALSKLCTAILLFFSFFQLCFSTHILKTWFGTESSMAMRLVCFGIIPLILCGYAMVGSMFLLISRNYRELLLHSVIAFIPSLLLLLWLSSPDSLGIYAILLSASVFYLIQLILDHISLKRHMHYIPKVSSALIAPFLCALIAILPVFLLSLLFGLFLPSVMILILCFIIGFLLFFFLLCKTELLNSYLLKELPLGIFFLRLGRLLHFLR